MANQESSYPVYNPTNEERHQLLKTALDNVGRSEDYENIIRLLNPPEDILNYAKPGEMKGVKIGIIGGGLAGLAAAYELRKTGADITILDALEDRIGGRVYTYYFDDYNKEYYGEFGPMRIPVSHETTWHYINLFQLDTVSLKSRNSAPFLYAHNVRLRKESGSNNVMEYLYPLYNLSPIEQATPWPNLQKYALSHILNNLTSWQRTEIFKILPTYSPEYAVYTQMSNREIFEMFGLSQGAINLLSSIDPITGSLINTSYNETLQETYSLDFMNIYRIQDGMAKLPLSFYQSLTSDNPYEYQAIPASAIGRVWLNYGCVVNGIYYKQDDPSVVLSYTDGDNYPKVDNFDYVICTIPFSTLREVEIKPFFSNQKMQAIRELNYSDSLKSLFLCNHRFWEEDAYYGKINGGISFTDLPILSIIYPSDHINCLSNSTCSPNEPGVLNAAYNFNQDSVRVGNLTKDRRFNLIKRNVEEVHGLPPGYLSQVVKNHKTIHWYDELWFRGAFAYNLPGQKINFAFSMIQPEYENHVFFAGEHTSVKHVWMQGALYSGMFAANTLAYNRRLNDIGRA